MAFILWDSEAFDEYIASLQKMERSLSSYLGRMIAIRKKLILFNTTLNDQALSAFLVRIETLIHCISEMDERVSKLIETMQVTAERFLSTEKRIASMGSDLLHASAMQTGYGNGKYPLHAAFREGTDGQFMPFWSTSPVEGSTADQLPIGNKRARKESSNGQN